MLGHIYSSGTQVPRINEIGKSLSEQEHILKKWQWHWNCVNWVTSLAQFVPSVATFPLVLVTDNVTNNSKQKEQVSSSGISSVSVVWGLQTVSSKPGDSTQSLPKCLCSVWSRCELRKAKSPITLLSSPTYPCSQKMQSKC